MTAITFRVAMMVRSLTDTGSIVTTDLTAMGPGAIGTATGSVGTATGRWRGTSAGTEAQSNFHGVTVAAETGRQQEAARVTAALRRGGTAAGMKGGVRVSNAGRGTAGAGTVSRGAGRRMVGRAGMLATATGAAQAATGLRLLQHQAAVLMARCVLPGAMHGGCAEWPARGAGTLKLTRRSSLKLRPMGLAQVATGRPRLV